MKTISTLADLLRPRSSKPPLTDSTKTTLVMQTHKAIVSTMLVLLLSTGSLFAQEGWTEVELHEGVNEVTIAGTDLTVLVSGGEVIQIDAGEVALEMLADHATKEAAALLMEDDLSFYEDGKYTVWSGNFVFWTTWSPRGRDIVPRVNALVRGGTYPLRVRIRQRRNAN